MRPTIGLAGLVGGLGFLVAGCGGGSSSTATGAPSATAAARSVSCSSLAGFTGPVSDHGSASVTSATLSVTADDFFFAPTCETGVRPGTVTLVIHNAGHTLHNVEIKEQNIDMDVGPGEAVTVQVRVGNKPLQYLCKYHRTSGMVGALLPNGS